VDLSMKLSLFQIASLARLAQGVVGNDTGPTHIASGVGAPTVVPWSTGASDPYIYAPKGPHIRVLAVADLKTLSQKEVARVFFDLISHKTLDSGVGVLASST
jgi:ADP-heptose:LPS heptosyltransferase